MLGQVVTEPVRAAVFAVAGMGQERGREQGVNDRSDQKECRLHVFQLLYSLSCILYLARLREAGILRYAFGADNSKVVQWFGIGPLRPIVAGLSSRFGSRYEARWTCGVVLSYRRLDHMTGLPGSER